MLAACLVVFASTAGAAAAPAHVTPTRYYLALGDSLSTGGGATPGQGYVDHVFAFASRSIGGLKLENLGCGGDSTTRMISGGLCHHYATGNQLGDAEAFLRAHAHQVAFITIDVGGDDIVGCALTGTINGTCVQRALAHVATNMQIILAGLRAAGGNVPIVGMKYYDPILADYLKGPTGQVTAVQSVGVSNSGGGTLNWSASAATSSGGNWLAVSPTSGANAGTLTVSAGVGTLIPGTYVGAITVAATGAANTPQTVPVTLTVTAAAIRRRA